MASPYRRAASRVVNALPAPVVSSAPRFNHLLPSWPSATQGMSAYGSVGILFAIVSKLAYHTAAPEWKLYRRATGPDVERTEVTTHAALTVLNNPNDFYTRFELFEAHQQHIELTGEGVVLIGRNSRMRNLPLEMWIIRPDRIEPVPSKDTFIAGYIYHGPNGEKIPLELDEVIVTKLPNPLDPYRGLGVVQSILVDLDSSIYTAQWNLNFFKNSAEPGGVIAVPRRLSQTEWEEMRYRWDEQHKGVSRAHRVAILENAQWIDRKFTHRDMQFAELRKVSDEQIRQAFAFPRPMLGTVDDTNRANMEAAQDILDRSLTVPRLDRLKGMLNHRFLPLFGETAKGLEFDYESPVSEDESQENETRKNKAETFEILIRAGVDLKDAAEYCELPTFTMAPKPEPVIPDPEQDAPVPPGARARSVRSRRVRNAEDLDDDDLPDIEHVQAAWTLALSGLLADFGSVLASWFDTLVEQVAGLAGYTPGFSTLRVPTLAGLDVLSRAMSDMARSGAASVVLEAARQGIELPAGIVPAETLDVRARSVVDMLAQDYQLSAGREALRTGGNVEALREHLVGLTDARLQLYLGNALTQAQHAGRLASLAQASGVDGPTPAFYSSEQLDSATCDPCRKIHGKWLGNDIGTDVPRFYPMGGFVSCLGRQRCRGQVVVVWRAGEDRSIWLEKESV